VRTLTLGLAGIVLTLALPTRPAAGGEAEKLLVGFEIDEMKPRNSGGATWAVGQAWNAGEPKPGWRFKDAPELALPENHDGDVTIYECQ